MRSVRGTLFVVAGVLVLSGAGYAYWHYTLVKQGPSAHDVCDLSMCWGHLGCNYLMCVRPNGSRYNQYLPGDRSFNPSDYVQKINMPTESHPPVTSGKPSRPVVSQHAFNISSSTSPVGWKMFTDVTAGFSISFPATFTPDGKEDYTSSYPPYYPNEQVYQYHTPNESGNFTDQFAIIVKNESITQEVIASWGEDVRYSAQITFNGKQFWETEESDGGISVLNFFYNLGDSAVEISFEGGNLVNQSTTAPYAADKSEHPSTLTPLGTQILDTLAFNK